MSDFAIPGLMPRAGTPASIPSLRPPQGEPLDTERQLKAVVEDLVRARKQRDYDFLARAAAAGTMQELQADKLREMAGGDTLQAMQFASLGMSMAGEGWRVPETQLRYGDLLADLEAMGGSQYPEQMGMLRQQFEQSKGVAGALQHDQAELERYLSAAVQREHGSLGQSQQMNVLQSLIASMTLGTIGESGSRQSKLIEGMTNYARGIAKGRYGDAVRLAPDDLMRQGNPEYWKVTGEKVPGVPSEEEYARMLVRGAVGDLRKKASEHPDFKEGGGEAFARQVADLAGVVLPIGAAAEGAGALVKMAFKSSGLRRGLIKVMGKTGARVLGGTAKLGAQALTVGAIGAAMPAAPEQQNWLDIDVEQQIKHSGLQGEAAEQYRSAAKAAIGYQNAVSMAAMVPIMALVGPVAGKLGTWAGRSTDGPILKWAISRVGAGYASGLAMPAVSEFASDVSSRLAKATEGSEGLLEDIGRASQLGMIADDSSSKPVHRFLAAAAEGNVDGMKEALRQYGHEAAAPAATFGALQLLGVVHGYVSKRWGPGGDPAWNEMTREVGERAKQAAKQEIPPELADELARDGVTPEQFRKANEDLVDSQVLQLTTGEEAKPATADEVRAEPGGAKAIDEDVTVRVTEDSTAPTAKAPETQLQPGEEDAPRTIDQAIEDTHRAEDAAEEQIQVSTEEQGAPTAAEVAKQGLLRTERRILALEKQARNLDLSQPARERAAQMAAELRQHAREHRDWLEGGAAPDMEPPAPDMAPRGGLAREAAQSLVQGPPREEAAAGRVKARKGSAAAMLEETNLEFRRQADRINQAADLARRDDAEPGDRQAATKVVTEGRVALKRWVGELPPGTRVQDALGNRWTLLEPAPGQGEGVWRAVDENGRVVEKWNPDEWILGAPERVEFHSRVPKRELQALKNAAQAKAKEATTAAPVNAPAAEPAEPVELTDTAAMLRKRDKAEKAKKRRASESSVVALDQEIEQARQAVASFDQALKKASGPRATMLTQHAEKARARLAELEAKKAGAPAAEEEMPLEELQQNLDETIEQMESTPDGPTKRAHAQLVEGMTEELQRRTGERDPNDTSEADVAGRHSPDEPWKPRKEPETPAEHGAEVIYTEFSHFTDQELQQLLTAPESELKPIIDAAAKRTKADGWTVDPTAEIRSFVMRVRQHVVPQFEKSMDLLQPVVLPDPLPARQLAIERRAAVELKAATGSKQAKRGKDAPRSPLQMAHQEIEDDQRSLAGDMETLSMRNDKHVERLLGSLDRRREVLRKLRAQYEAILAGDVNAEREFIGGLLARQRDRKADYEASKFKGPAAWTQAKIHNLESVLAAINNLQGPPQEAAPEAAAVVAAEVIGKPEIAKVVEADAAKDGKAAQKERSKRRQAGDGKAAKADSESVRGKAKREKEVKADTPAKLLEVRPTLNRIRSLKTPQQRALWKIVKHMPVTSMAEIKRVALEGGSAPVPGIKVDPLPTLQALDLLDVTATAKANGVAWVNAEGAQFLSALSELDDVRRTWGVDWGLDESVKRRKPAPKVYESTNDELQGPINKSLPWRFVHAAVGKEETRYAINGVDVRGGWMAGTNGRTLHAIRIGKGYGEDRVVAQDGIRTIQAQFPPWQQIIPKGVKPIARYRIADLLQLVESLPVPIDGHTEIAQIALFDVPRRRGNVPLSVNAELLGDALRAFHEIGHSEVEVSAVDHHQPIVLKAPGRDDALALIMPISNDVAPGKLPAVGAVKMPGWEYVDVRHVQQLGVNEAPPKPVQSLPRPGGPFEIPADDRDRLQSMQRTSEVAAEIAADLIDSGVLNDHRDFAVALVDGLKDAGLWKSKSVDPYYGQPLATVIDTISSRESHAAKQGPGAYAQFLASIRDDVLHGPIGVALQYYEPGSKLIGRIVRNARKLRETDPGNPEAGALNIGAILDIPGALWGHARRFLADVFKPKIVEGLVSEMESAPKDRLGTVRRFLAQRGLLPPQSFAGFIARDGIRAIEEGVGAIEQYRRQLFGAGGLLDGIEEGSEASARIFDALDNPREIVRHEVVGMGVVEEVREPHPAWAALQPNELEIANKLRDLFEQFREHLASVHPRAVRLREEAERTTVDLDYAKRDMARIEGERDRAKALWDTLPDAQQFEEMRRAERAARKEAKKEGKEYETPRAFVEELADLQERALDAMREAGFRGGPSTYNGMLSRASRKANMLTQRRDALQKAHDQIISGYGLRDYVHHVIDVDASLDDLRDLFSGPALRNEGRMGRRQGWSDAQLRLDRKHAPRAGIGAKRTGKLEESGLLARDIVRSVWDYIHTFPVYLKRLEFMARYDRYLNGGLEAAQAKTGPDGGFAGHEAFDPHSEVIYNATAARSFGRMVAMFDEEGNVSFHRWQSLTDEQRDDITAAKQENRAFRARQRTLGLDPGPSEARMDRVILWLGSEDPMYAPTWERLADPGWVAMQMHSQGDDVGPTRVPLILALELEDAKNGIRLWRHGWYGRVLELADRARELGENPTDYKSAAENLARYIDEQILGASAEAATGLVHELGEEGLRAADNARQVFERVGQMVAAGLSAHAIGGPTNIRNALQAGGGGLVMAYASMGKLPSRTAIGAMRRYGRAQAMLRGLEQGFMKKLLRLVRLGVGGRAQLDLRTLAEQVGGWKHLNEAIETMELTPAAKLEKMGDAEREAHLFADEAIREALRLNLTGGNRGDQIGRMLDWTTQWLRGSGELRRRSFDVRRGEIVREGRMSMTNLLRKLSDAFWYPFNLGERFARVMPFIEQYVDARKAGADRAQASNRAFDFMQQAQLVYSRAAKMRAWNHPIMRMLSALTTWAAHAETRFGLVLGSMGPLSLGSRIGLWARLAAVTFIAWQLGIDLTRMTMSAASDVAGVGQGVTGIAGGVVPTADDPIGTQPKGPFGRGYIDIGTPQFDIPGIDLPIEHGRIATPNVPWPGFLTGPGPAFDLLGDLASSVAHLRYGDGAAAADSLASGFSNLNPFSSSASWLKRLRPSFEAERNPSGGFTWRDGDSTIRQWEKHPGLFAQGLDALGIEADWLDRFDLWASAQLPASRETHSWISAILEHESSRMHDAAAARAARTAEDLAWWDKKLQAATDPAEREVLQKQRDELGQQWFRQRLELGLPGDADEARKELRSSLRSAERRSAIMHEVPARLRVVAYAGSRRQQVEALTRALEDPYQLITEDNLRVLSEAVWPQDGIQGVLRDEKIPQASREALFQALQAKLKH